MSGVFQMGDDREIVADLYEKLMELVSECPGDGRHETQALLLCAAITVRLTTPKEMPAREKKRMFQRACAAVWNESARVIDGLTMKMIQDGEVPKSQEN